jgi:hypothetical protein
MMTILCEIFLVHGFKQMSPPITGGKYSHGLFGNNETGAAFLSLSGNSMP